MRDCQLNWLTCGNGRLEFQPKQTGDFSHRLACDALGACKDSYIADRALQFNVVLRCNDGSYDHRYCGPSNPIPDLNSKCDQNRENGNRRDDESLSPRQEHALRQDSTPDGLAISHRIRIVWEFVQHHYLHSSA